MRAADLCNAENDLQDEGVVAIAAALASNSSLTLLSVASTQRDCRVHPRCCRACMFAHLLAVNNVNDDGAHAIAALVQTNAVLTEVDFAGMTLCLQSACCCDDCACTRLFARMHAGNDFHEEILLPFSDRVKCF
jgi:hypothetical protein